MRSPLCACAVLLIISNVGSCAERRVRLDELIDHIFGGWVGQGVGVTFGDKYEFKTCGAKVENDPRSRWSSGPRNRRGKCWGSPGEGTGASHAVLPARRWIVGGDTCPT